MAFTVQQLIEVLNVFFPQSYPARNALLAIGTLAALVPLLQLHRVQQRRPRQSARTAWLDAILPAFRLLFRNDMLPDQEGSTREQNRNALRVLSADVDALADIMDLDTISPGSLLPVTPTIVCTPRRLCSRCPPDGARAPYVLYRHEEPQRVYILTATLHRERGVLVSAHCTTCKSHFYPDRVSFPDPSYPRRRLVQLEADPEFVRISRPDNLWVHRDVMRMQAAAFYNLHSGWSTFAQFVSDSSTMASGTVLNDRQSKRMFVEHFGRRLLLAHGKLDSFTCRADPTTDDLVEGVVSRIGSDFGMGPAALSHRCTECCHKKRTAEQPAAEGVPQPGNNRFRVLGEAGEGHPVDQDLEAGALPQPPPAALDDDDEELMVNLAVMDGKTIQHWICAVTTCRNSLTNYKTGRFCDAHEELAEICAISFCNQSVADDLPVCAIESHVNWYQHYRARFGRLSYRGVRRVVRQQTRNADEGRDGPNARVQLPDIDGLRGNDVEHTLRPRSVYCIQTAQWACGYPIAWTKLYGSESLSQVYGFIDRVWPEATDRPSFIAYDLACKFLRYIVTSKLDGGWLSTTRFIVDAWHYINHRSDDEICRVWCNPAPMDGSQPDLVIAQEDADGNTHRTRAFNLETAEQFNSWLDKYKGLLEQMPASSHDFVMHVLFMLYAERVSARAAAAAVPRRQQRARRRTVETETDSTAPSN